MGEVLNLSSRFAQQRGSIVATHCGLEALAKDLGTPADWLGSAVDHLKEAVSGRDEGSATVSVAALHLVLFRLEELEHGGEPWGGAA